jgi:hypothetical protein
MFADEFKFIRYMNADTRRFSFWLIFITIGKWELRSGKTGRKRIIEHFEKEFGPLEKDWQYSRPDDRHFIIKLDNESLATMAVLRYGR